MEKNYNFKFNLEEFDGDVICKYMDFDVLFYQFEEQKVFQQWQVCVCWLVYIVMVVVVVVVLFLVLFIFFCLVFFIFEVYFVQQDYVCVFLFDMNIDFEVKIVVDVYCGGVIDYFSGFCFVILVVVFMDDCGKLIGGEVEIYYCEFYDYIDFFVLGIFMVYDLFGMQCYLIFVGMVEVYVQ